MRFSLIITMLVTAARAFADVSVSASVDQARVAFGESITFTISINGAQNAPQPALPKVDGLTFAGPSVNTSMSWVNGQTSQSVTLTYQVASTRIGEFTIPAIEVTVAGKNYRTDPIRLTVDKSGRQSGMQDALFAKVRLNSQQIFLGQTAPLDVILFARANVPVRGLGGFSAEADGLSYKYNGNVKSGSQVINGETFNVYLIEGAISPTRTGRLNFGPAVLKAQLTVSTRNRSLIDEMMGRVAIREVPVIMEAVPIEVLPLPSEGRPADFAGAIGQWNLEVAAKPTEVAVGDPITVVVKVIGTGNLDTVPPLVLKGLDSFKAYDPTSKTTKNDLNTTGERTLQQVLIAKDTAVTQIPAVQLSYFDPIATTYKTVTQGPIRLTVKASGGGASTIVSGGQRLQPTEKLGQDIVYLKGDTGPLPAESFLGTPVFWVWNLIPVIGLIGALAWKRRVDRLCGDIAYARRSRAARQARKSLTVATNYEQVQRALQEYLGDRLNIPASGLTASVVEEHRLPCAVRGVFEACDAARFAGAAMDVAELKQQVEQVINELESAQR